MKMPRFGIGSLMVLLIPAVAGAQLTEPMPEDGPVVAFELAKPFLEDGDGFGFFSTALRGTVVAPLGDRLSFLGELGLTTATANDSRSTTLSNLELGLLFSNDEGMPRGRLTVVLPTSAEFGDDDFAFLIGWLSDPDRVDRYAEELWSVNGLFTPTRRLESGTLGFKVGGSAMVPTGDGDAEFFGRYGVFVTQSTGTARFGAELTGQAILSEGGLDFGERTIHQLTILAGLERSGPSPELFVRVPLDEDISDVVNVIVGLRVVF